MRHKAGEAGKGGQHCAQPFWRWRTIGARGKKQALRQKKQRAATHDPGNPMRIQHLEKKSPHNRADDAEGQQKLEQALVKSVPEGSQAEQVHQQKYRHQYGRRLRHGDDQRHHGHCQRPKACAKATFAQAQQQHGRNGDGVEMPVCDEGQVQS